MAQDVQDLNEEVGLFDLFLRRAPCDIVREEVREERLGQMNRQAAEEKEAVCVVRKPIIHRCDEAADLQEWDPGNVLEERGDEASLAEVVLEKGIPEVTCAGEDDGTCQPYLERVLVEAIDIEQ